MSLSTLAVSVGGEAVVKATFYDTENNICEPSSTVTWSSSNTSVATLTTGANRPVDLNSRVRINGISAGTCTISAASYDLNNNPLSTSLTLTVYSRNPTSIGINLTGH